MRIYTIDDDSIERSIWEDWLPKEHSWQYRVCQDFRELRLAFELAVPDVCIVDLEMPYMPGTDVVRFIKASYPDVKVLVCSGYDEPQYEELAASLGAGFISKTLGFEARMEVIRELYARG